MRAARSFLVTLLAASALQAAAADRKETFAKAMELANANLETPAGKAYDADLAKRSMEQDEPLLKACVEARKGQDMSSFTLLLKVGADGAILTALAHPETTIAVCFRDKLKQEKFPKPPSADHWVVAQMNLGR
jgi:hypothetical protein